MWWPSEIEAAAEHLASKRRRGRIYGKWVFLRTFRSGQKNPQVPGKAHVGWSFSILRHVPVCGDYKELSRGLLWSSRLSWFLLAEEINWLVLLDRDMKPPCERLGVVQVGTWEHGKWGSCIYSGWFPFLDPVLSHGLHYLYHFLLRCYCFLDSWTRLPEFESLLCQVPSVQPQAHCLKYSVLSCHL